MKFRMFTDYISGEKVAINVDRVMKVVEKRGCSEITIAGDTIAADAGRAAFVCVEESFAVVFSRLNTVAD